jgi:hypothetical protein
MRGPASCASFNALGIQWRSEEARFRSRYSDSSSENSTSKCRARIKYIDDDDNDDNNNILQFPAMLK